MPPPTTAAAVAMAANAIGAKAANCWVGPNCGCSAMLMASIKTVRIVANAAGRARKKSLTRSAGGVCTVTAALLPLPRTVLIAALLSKETGDQGLPGHFRMAEFAGAFVVVENQD